MDQLLQLLQTFLNSITPITDDAPEALNLFVFFVQWSAIILSVLAGLYAARRRGMDFFGALVIAFVVSLGGGTIRDLLIGRSIFWVTSPVYPITVVVIVFASVFVGGEAKRSPIVADKIAKPVERIADTESRSFIVIDSLALGLWAYLGTLYALEVNISSFVAPIMGVVTATFGGVLRDMFFAQVPQIFLPSQFYAAAAAVGAILFVVLRQLNASENTSFLACLAVTFILRLASIKFNIQSR